MAAAVDTPRERRRLVLAGCLLTTADLATRLAMLWRFPWYVDETTFRHTSRALLDGFDNPFYCADCEEEEDHCRFAE